jgi:hypothetical protein
LAESKRTVAAPLFGVAALTVAEGERPHEMSALAAMTTPANAPSPRHHFALQLTTCLYGEGEIVIQQLTDAYPKFQFARSRKK